MLVTLTVNVADFFINPEMFLATHVHILPSCDVTSLKKTQNALYLSVKVFNTKLSSYASNRRRDRHFTWSSEPREGGLAGYTANSQYFKTLSIGPAPGNEPATSRSAIKRSTD